MKPLVDTPGLKISVQDTSDICVCIKCKGGKVYREVERITSGWLWGPQKPCNLCKGKGFWRVK